MIIFGKYAFTFKRFSAGQHGIPTGAEVIVKCRVFQLFFIPFCPIGKSWILRSNGQDEQVPSSIRRSIELTETTRTPFYAFAWLIIIPLVFAGYTYSEKRELAQRLEDRINQNIERIYEVQTQIDVARPGLIFSTEEVRAASHCGGTYSFLMVERVAADSLLLLHPFGNKEAYSPYRYLIRDQKPYAYTWVSRGDLKAAADNRKDELGCNKGVKVPGLTTGHGTFLKSEDATHSSKRIVWADLPFHAEPPYGGYHPKKRQ